MNSSLSLNYTADKLSLDFLGELNLYNINSLQKNISQIDLKNIQTLILNLKKVSTIDTAAALFLLKIQEEYKSQNLQITLICDEEKILATLELVKLQRVSSEAHKKPKRRKLLSAIHEKLNSQLEGFFSFMAFFGRLMMSKVSYLHSFENIRFKEIAFEINESGIKALGIVALTSFLIGLVVAYQSAYQLKIYGANIFIVDMLGISMLRELAPLITAIVIAGRSGSAFTAQIGAMKITQELDAMKTMGFDPYVFLVMPRVVALMISLPILIFVADIMGILGGMIVSYIDLGITTNLFVDRFREVVDAKHFFIGILKGPFFAFLIASIGIYRGVVVKDDTQSIGFNTTKSVVESIFAVIVCDALFSIAFTNLGI
ncbi:MAG: MlaE family lipid ABC transporter permease subunit [Campylobacterota bacterium]|nr:MlaE family lipid ABC transporter permease subunit [Campylobacterota bacterium]